MVESGSPKAPTPFVGAIDVHHSALERFKESSLVLLDMPTADEPANVIERVGLPRRSSKSEGGFKESLDPFVHAPYQASSPLFPMERRLSRAAGV